VLVLGEEGYQTLFEQVAHLNRALGSRGLDLLAKGRQDILGSLDPDIRLDKQHFELIPGFVGDFVCPEEARDTAKNRLARARNPVLYLVTAKTEHDPPPVTTYSDQILIIAGAIVHAKTTGRRTIGSRNPGFLLT